MNISYVFEIIGGIATAVAVVAAAFYSFVFILTTARTNRNINLKASQWELEHKEKWLKVCIDRLDYVPGKLDAFEARLHDLEEFQRGQKMGSRK